jgi:glycosidase
MSEIQDFMFGDQILPEKRLATYRAALAGVQHNFDASPPRPRSGETITLRATTAGDIPFQELRVFYTLDGAAPDPERCPWFPFCRTAVTWDGIDWQYVTHWQAQLPAQADDTMIRYRVAGLLTGGGEWVYADNQAREASRGTNFALWVSDLPEPAWTQDAMVYHVFIDRFNPGEGKHWNKPEGLSGFYGGTLLGVEQKLDYIHELGYNVLWLSPFFASPSHHGYDATDMYQVEPRLGTNEDLYRLVDSAHRRGMRLILDFVANHWSDRHPTLQAAIKDRNSPYVDWYLWKKWPDEYEGYFGVKDMPKLNLALGSPARQYLLDCARFWLEKGFDGFRLDFAYGPPLDFWVDFRRVCKQVRPDCWLFGEVIQSAPEQRAFAVAFDGMIDFLLAEALRQTFGYGRWQVDVFDAYLTGHEAYFQGLFDRLTILDNHDMNRFLFLAGDDPRRLKLGALLIYTLAGNPINYYGTEAGVTQEHPTHYGGHGYFEEARQPMRWGEAADTDLLNTFQWLTALRRENPALRSGSRRTVHLDTARQIYAYVRELGPENWLVAFNLSEEEQTLVLPELFASAPQDYLSAIFNNQDPIQVEGDRMVLKLPPLSGALIK